MAQFHTAKRLTWPVFVRRVTLAQPTVNLLSPAARHPRPTPHPPSCKYRLRTHRAAPTPRLMKIQSLYFFYYTERLLTGHVINAQ